jgi:alkylated DNA repair dioxygenase AlkB
MDLNETLFLAYLPDMSMGRHKDGEAGLKDVVISLSFGTNCKLKVCNKGYLLDWEETNNHGKGSTHSR